MKEMKRKKMARMDQWRDKYLGVRPKLAGSRDVSSPIICQSLSARHTYHSKVGTYQLLLASKILTCKEPYRFYKGLDGTDWKVTSRLLFFIPAQCFHHE